MLMSHCVVGAAVQPRSTDPSKDLDAYGYRSVPWKELMRDGSRSKSGSSRAFFDFSIANTELL
jgi:hypothetical protein